MIVYQQNGLYLWPLLIIITDELQVFDDLINVHLTRLG